PLLFRSFLFYCSAHHRDLHSFPTRRSSDLRSSSPVKETLTPPWSLRAGGSRRRCRDAGVLALRTGAAGQRSRGRRVVRGGAEHRDRKSTRLNSSHVKISYAVFCLKKKKNGW